MSETKNLLCRKITHEELSQADFQANVVDFLHRELEEFRDPKEDIQACIEYLLNPAHGGQAFAAMTDEGQLYGIVLLAKTNMHRFVPNYLLVYIATAKASRGQGIGGKLLKMVQQEVQAPIALHCEYNNPAKRLYEKVGFTSKYAEMRWFP